MVLICFVFFSLFRQNEGEFWTPTILRVFMSEEQSVCFYIYFSYLKYLYIYLFINLLLLKWCHGVVDSTCDTEQEWHGFDSQP